MPQVATPSPFASRTNSMASTSVHPSTAMESSWTGGGSAAAPPTDAAKEARVLNVGAPFEGDGGTEGDWDPGNTAEPSECVIPFASKVLSLWI